MARRQRYGLLELAAEVMRRGDDSCVVRLSTPPTASERLQLLNARLRRKPIVIMPVRCASVDEWLARHSPP
jgi:hypothetical protein